ncbi:glycoside hydrolase family 13 protein [Candidatus Sumerlaeota bacterium]|nr:glycoside hydrolase family 13 protein [Candidatus Sumerlaeota bacterium]
MRDRAEDWRFGRVIYQIFVDRFAPSADLDAKRLHYAHPRRIKAWEELPERGVYLPDHRVHEAEMQFWGGDLKSVASKFDYVQAIGSDVVYLNPIFLAYSNHKYDCIDYFTIDPQYGNLDDLRELVRAAHARGLRVILDGVFNHMGRRAHWFQAAEKDLVCPERGYFSFGESHKNGYLGWRDVANLPEVNLENDDVRAKLIDGVDSVVQYYLRDIDIDGWRLDVAPDVGFEYLRVITENSRAAKHDAVVIGECWNYPEEWLTVMDGVLNMHARTLILELCQNRVTPLHASRCFAQMVQDAGIEGILKSHLVLDNHDTPRLGTLIADAGERSIARTLQFLLPGSPVVYYGTELGMKGGADPENRAPMRWDLESDDNEEFALTKKLIALRRDNPALMYGDYRALESDSLLAFLRFTDRARETIIVLVNPTKAEARGIVPIRDSRLMDAAQMECLLSGERAMLHCGFIEITMPPQTTRVFRTVDRGDEGGYTAFKRV